MDGWDLLRTVAPDTADEVRDALSWPDQSWEGSHRLAFPEAVAELLAWLNDPRSFNAVHHREAFNSVLRDYRAVVKDGIGTNVKAELRLVLKKVEAELLQLDPAKNRTSAARAMQDLLISLKHHGVLQAAWRDLWSKCGRPESPADVIAIRRDLFLSLARLAGHDLRRLTVLKGVLASHAWDVRMVRGAIGDPVPSAVDEDDELPRAQLKASERNTLCERFLALPPGSGSHVVMLAYERASMALKTVDSLGDITFLMSEYVPDNPDAASAKLSSLCKDWTPTDAQFLAGMPHKIGIVNVRVLLPAGVYADPVAVARARVEALVAIGKFHAQMPSKYWRGLPGHKRISDWAHSEHRIETTPYTQKSLDHGRQAAIYAAMASFWAKVDGTVAIDDSRLIEAVDLLRWWQAAEEQSHLSQVMASVRVVETAASRVNTVDWTDHLATHMKATWSALSIHCSFDNTVREAVGGDPTGLPVKDRQRLQTLKDATLKVHEFGYIEVLPGTTRAALTELLNIYPEHHRTARRLRALAKRLDNPQAFKRWCAQIENRWTNLVDRLARIRNAITHGGPATPEAIRSVAPFSMQMGAWTVQIALESALTGADLADAHKKFNSDSKDLLDRMHRAAKPGDVIHDSAVPPLLSL